MGLFSSAPITLDSDLERVLVVPSKPEWLNKDCKKQATRYWASLSPTAKEEIRLLLYSARDGVVFVDDRGVTFTGGVWRGLYKFQAIRDCRANPFQREWVVDFVTLTAGEIFATFRTQEEASRLVEVVHGI